MTDVSHRYLYLAPTGEVATLVEPSLGATTERHKVPLTVPDLEPPRDVLRELDSDQSLRGVVLEMYVGWPGREHLLLAMRVLRRGRRVWLYWPKEHVVECVDRVRLPGYWRQMLFLKLLATFTNDPTTKAAAKIDRAVVSEAELAAIAAAWAHLNEADHLFENPTPVEWPHRNPGKIRGCGVYLRTDFWNRFESGGSYGHT